MLRIKAHMTPRRCIQRGLGPPLGLRVFLLDLMLAVLSVCQPLVPLQQLLSPGWLQHCRLLLVGQKCMPKSGWGMALASGVSRPLRGVAGGGLGQPAAV